MNDEKDMHKTGWSNIDLPPHLKKAREAQRNLLINLLRKIS